MTYIILHDTFGRGLETISNIGLEIIEEHELDDYICDATEIILEEVGYESLSKYEEKWDDGANSIGNEIVICEIVGELKGKSVDTYILDVLKGQEEKQNKEEYQLYLQLKEKFEK